MFEDAKPVSLGFLIKTGLKNEITELVKMNLKISKIVSIGSSRAPMLNDIDLAIESTLDSKQMQDILVSKLGEKNVKLHSGGLSFLYKNVQVDLYVGNVDYLRWARAGAFYVEKQFCPIKGVFRNLLLNTLLRVASNDMFPENNDLNRKRYALDFDRGLNLITQTKQGKSQELKEWKTLEREHVSNVPAEIVQFIFQRKIDPYYKARTFIDVCKRVKDSPHTSKISSRVFSEFLHEIKEMDASSTIFGEYPKDAIYELLVDTIEQA